MPGEVTLQGTSISYVLQAPSGARSGGPAERSQLTLHVYCIDGPSDQGRLIVFKKGPKIRVDWLSINRSWQKRGGRTLIMMDEKFVLIAASLQVGKGQQQNSERESESGAKVEFREREDGGPRAWLNEYLYAP